MMLVTDVSDDEREKLMSFVRVQTMSNDIFICNSLIEFLLFHTF